MPTERLKKIAELGAKPGKSILETSIDETTATFVAGVLRAIADFRDYKSASKDPNQLLDLSFRIDMILAILSAPNLQAIDRTVKAFIRNLKTGTPGEMTVRKNIAGITDGLLLCSLSPFAKNPGHKPVDESEESIASEGFRSRRSAGRRYPDRKVEGASYPEDASRLKKIARAIHCFSKRDPSVYKGACGIIAGGEPKKYSQPGRARILNSINSMRTYFAASDNGESGQPAIVWAKEWDIFLTRAG